MKSYYVYILASKANGTLYVGITSDLVRRIYQHRSDVMDGFTKEYSVHDLVHYEVYDDPETSIRREKLLKKWNREWKINLIKGKNPNWEDLYPALLGSPACAGDDNRGRGDDIKGKA